MRLLLFYGPEFWFRTHSKVVADAPDDFREGRVEGAVVAFVHAEPKDEADPAGVETKLVKNVKWLAGKFGTKTAALHYFSHLGPELAPGEVSRGLMERARARLEAVGFRVEVTPYGHFCEWRLGVAGESLAKVWKEL